MYVVTLSCKTNFLTHHKNRVEWSKININAIQMYLQPIISLSKQQDKTMFSREIVSRSGLFKFFQLNFLFIHEIILRKKLWCAFVILLTIYL